MRAEKSPFIVVVAAQTLNRWCPTDLVGATAVSTVVVAAEITVADLTDQRPTGFGVTSENFRTADYHLTQR